MSVCLFLCVPVWSPAADFVSYSNMLKTNCLVYKVIHNKHCS